MFKEAPVDGNLKVFFNCYLFNIYFNKFSGTLQLSVYTLFSIKYLKDSLLGVLHVSGSGEKAAHSETKKLNLLTSNFLYF